MPPPTRLPQDPAPTAASLAWTNPRRQFLALIAAIFFIELGVMLALHAVDIPSGMETAIDSTLLALLLTPVIYRVVIRPMQSRLRAIADAERSLRESLAWNRGIVDAAFECILITDERGIIQDSNPAAERVFGYTHDELDGAGINLLIPEGERQRHDRYLAAYVQQSGQHIIGLDRTVHGRRKDGTVFPLEIAITELSGGNKRHFVAMARDITQRTQDEAALREARDELEQRVRERTTELSLANDALRHEVEERARMQEELQRLASTDTLTGIRNRRVFEEFAAIELKRAERYGDPLALILFDVDHFKRINDTFGHHVGDEVLVQIAALVAGRVRASEIFARWGGEEFILLLPQTDAANALLLADDLRGRLEGYAIPPVGQVTASFGVTCFARGDTLDAMMHRVDAALYRAKDQGRNRVERQLPA